MGPASDVPPTDATDDGRGEPADPGARRREVVVAGHVGDRAAARAGLADPDPTVRTAAVGAVVRAGGLGRDDVERLAVDGDGGVRRRLAEVLADRAGPPVDDGSARAVLERLVLDRDPGVAEAAIWALGERFGADPTHGEPAPGADAALVATLSTAATGHEDPLCREAAVAALGSVGRPDGLEAVLAACADKPAVRRRAAVALAAFADDPRAGIALARLAEDRDWQVRDVAEVLRGDDG